MNAPTLAQTLLLAALVGYGLYVQLQSIESQQHSRRTPLLFAPEQTTPEVDSDLLLSVPFFVYEDLAWTNATINGKLISCCDDMVPHPGVGGVPVKHFEDYYFMKAALRHPMRTRDPEQAKIFVIPILFNAWFDRKKKGHEKYKLCWNGMCNYKLFKWAANRLEEYGYIDRYPEKHIHVMTHWGRRWLLGVNVPPDFDRKRVAHITLPQRMEEYVVNTHQIQFEDRTYYNSPTRSGYPSTYIGNPCPVVERSQKVYDVAFIASIERNRIFPERRKLCTWLGNVQDPFSKETTYRFIGNESEFQVPVCGHGQMCPALAEAKLTFHVAGDTYGSQRLMDAIGSGTVPVFTHEMQYKILPDWIDWRQMSYFIDMDKTKTAEDFQRQIRTILNNEQEYEAKYQAVMRHWEFLDWSTLYPFDTYMYKLQSELYPETRRSEPSTKWSALLLSKLNS